MKFKAHSLTGRITIELMYKAFKNIKRNRGAAGIDKQSIKMFEQNLEENLLVLMKDLKTRGRYKPKPLKRKEIPKDRNKTRKLGIPAVRDRIAQEVIRKLIEPYFEPKFSDKSFGFRPNRNAHQAIEEIIRLRKHGYCFVLDADIEGFFDNIPHDLIMKLVAEEIADGNILEITCKILNSGVVEDGVFVNTIKGTPQGGVISPLLANIVLDLLDKKLVNSGYAFVRYADDFIVLGKSTAEVEKARQLVQNIIKDELGLRLSPEKTKITSFREGFDFLGFHLIHTGVHIRDKSVEKFKDKIRNKTIRSYNFSDEVIREINRISRGFANYFSTEFSNVKQQFLYSDKFTRRRLRCMKTKRISKLDNFKIPNKYFQRKGLISLTSLNYKS